MENNNQNNKEKKELLERVRQSRDAIEIDLVEIFYVLLSYWKLILIILIVGVVLGGAYQKVCVGHSYKADASIFIANTDSVITISDMQLSSELSVDYQKILTSRVTLKRVIDDINLNMNYRQLSQLVGVTSEESSHVLTISATTSDPKLSQNIANSLMNVGIDRIQKVVNGSEATIVDGATRDAVIEVTPSIFKYAGIGGLLALCLSCLIIIIAYLSDNTIKTEEDIQEWFEFPVLAGIPYYGKGKNMVLDKLNYYEKESFNTLCGNISLSGFDTRVIAVTSASPDEGKSSLAFKLAETLTDYKKNVIYVDCDMRNSTFCSLYGIDKKTTKGLSEYLSGSVTVNDVLIRDEKNNKLFIVCAGKNPPTPGALLSGERFKSFVEALKGSFDYVILDTPPVNAVIDGIFISNVSDGTVMVVESGVTERASAERALNELIMSEANVLGIIINKIGQKKVRYGYGGYGYGYGKYGKYGRKYGYGYGKKYGYGYGRKYGYGYGYGKSYGYGYGYGSVDTDNNEKPEIDKKAARKAEKKAAKDEKKKKDKS